MRLFAFDTSATPPLPIWQDEEITAVLLLFSSQNIIIGLSGYSPSVPVRQIYPYRRCAAALLRGLASNKARMSVVGLLDAKLNGAQAAAALNAVANKYISDEENEGYFAVAEMVQDSFSMRERLWKQLYRLDNAI